MINSCMSKSIRFHINSLKISGNFALSFEPYIISEIENEIDNFVYNRKKKIKKEHLSIQKVNNVYEINVPAFIAICNIIYRVLKNYK